MIQNILLIMKPTLACNAQCSYCIYSNNYSIENKMSVDNFIVILDKLKQYSKKFPQLNIDFLWHGGESTLMGEDFFNSIYNECNAFKKYFSTNHLIQTNLLTNNAKVIDSIIKLLEGKNQISTSFDPIENIRLYGNSNNYKKNWITNVFKLQEQGYYPNIVYTVHNGSIGHEHEIYYFFKNLGIKNIRINPMINYLNLDGIQLSVENFGKFLINMWEIWINDKLEVKIEPFQEWYNLMYNNQNHINSCSFDGKCSKNIFSIIENGDVYPCGKHFEFNIEKLGNIYDETIESINLKKHLYAQGELVHQDCQNCHWYQFCQGGCPMENDFLDAKNYTKTRFCESYKMLFEKISLQQELMHNE